jgi:hypothetical protein
MKKEIDYYGNEADYIHLKFGDCRKNYNFTKEFIKEHELFAREYAKYFDDKTKSQFKNPFQIVHYAYKNEIPVHFYYNFTDTPATSEEEIMEYLVGENAYVADLKE